MSCVLRTQQFAFFLEKNGTLIVLVKHHLVDLKVLHPKKVVGPQQDGHEVIGSDKLGLCGTSSVELLLD